MSKLIQVVRKLGVMPLAKATATRCAQSFGMVLQHRYNTPRETWMGLKECSFGTILDVGANVGQFASEASANFPDATIHSFEPLSDVFETLSGVAKQSGGKIIAHNYGLGEVSGPQTIDVPVDFKATSSVLGMTDNTHTLYPTTTKTKPTEILIQRLDDVSASLDIFGKGDLLVKMDVQGFEDRVVRGGMDTLKQAKTVLLEVLIAPLYEGQADFGTLHDLMRDLGLVYVGNFDQYCDPQTGRVLFLDAVFMRETE